MGFYPPDSLVHEAQRRGIAVHPPDVNESDAGCTVAGGAVRVGLGYVHGVRADDVAALVAERERGGPFRSLEDLASRAGAGRPALERLAWSGACDALAGGSRRRALWALGVATPGVTVGGRATAGTQLALPLDTGTAPELPALGGWDRAIADYATTGLTTGPHPLALARERLDARGCRPTAGLAGLRHRSKVRVGGLVVARQRPATASGVCFILLEDEHGTVNLIVPPELYRRERAIIRTEPLLIADGIFERHPEAGGGVNVLCKSLTRLSLDDTEAGRVTHMPAAEDDFRAVAPPVQSFAQGRRR